MKMAKASEADIEMALELSTMLEGFERGNFPVDEDAEDYEPFYDDNPEHCRRAMDLIIDKLRAGSLFRVVFGMSVLLDPKNEAVDHSLDYLEHHPKVRMHDELAGALRGLMDTGGVRLMLAGLAKGVGTAHQDGLAVRAAESAIAKLEAKP